MKGGCFIVSGRSKEQAMAIKKWFNYCRKRLFCVRPARTRAPDGGLRGSGQGLVEYVLLIALVGLVVTGGMTVAGGGIAKTYESVVGALKGQATTPPDPSPPPASPGDVVVLVVDDVGQPLTGVLVHAFVGDKTHYSGITLSTPANGQATFSQLPADAYFFRADYLGNAYWSAQVNVPDQTSTTITVSLCEAVSLSGATFLSKGKPLDGLIVALRVENKSGRELTISEVTLDWNYLRKLPEEPRGKMRLYGVYVCPGNDPDCNVGNRRQFINNIDHGWRSDLDATTSPTTVNANPQPLPTNGAYIGFDFDSLASMDFRSFSDPPWKLVPSDFGFTVRIKECAKPLTMSAKPR
jgi:Flp pilus assembly pilin Flp